jgi:hypothetical protein
MKRSSVIQTRELTDILPPKTTHPLFTHLQLTPMLCQGTSIRPYATNTEVNHNPHRKKRKRIHEPTHTLFLLFDKNDNRPFTKTVKSKHQYPRNEETMQLFPKLTPEERDQLIETIYTGTLAINLLLLPCILSATPDLLSRYELLNLSMGIPAAAGAILIKRVQRQSTPLDRLLGYTAIGNSTAGIDMLFWHFFPQAALTFIICTILATALVITAQYTSNPKEEQAIPSTPQDNYQETTPNNQQKNTRRRKKHTRSR